jgi:DNA ligase D-like protein (predicted ligase)
MAKPRKIQDQLDDEERRALRRASLPDWREPMLATLTDERFSSAEWLYERKLDGERCLARISAGQVRLLSRNRQSLDKTYPELVDALRHQRCGQALVDGEVVAFDGARTSFARLQERLGISDVRRASQSEVRVYFYLFDLLHLDSYDTRSLPLRTRKHLLRSSFGFRQPIRFTPHRNEQGVDFYTRACERGWEGVIAKRADSHYSAGRSRDWLKFKCVSNQELIICGYTEPTGQRKAFGALLLGYYARGRLRYAGKVGAGFDDRMLETLASRLRGCRRKTSPFDDDEMPSENADITWVTPALVAEIGFTEWTAAGRLRHPRFIGLREDKPATDVVREHAS